jgi:acetylornithine/N-succinyldiaminopimelate aminotransferase
MSEITEKTDRYMMPTYARQPVEFVRGEGCYLFDVDGVAYLDFLSGLSINNLGHCHPAVVAAVKEQAGTLINTCNLYYTGPQAELARLITTNSIGGKVFFSNSGAEANECAIKLARKHGHEQGGESKTRIITLENGFHGRTMASLSATAQPAKQEPFKPLLPDFTYVPRNEIDELQRQIDSDVCALILEPVQGEGGVYPMEQGYVEAARELADEHSALLVFDEVQTGMGRTGKLFAFEHYGVKPDVMTLAKSLGGALPIGATVAAPAFADVLGPGMHGSTFGGGPVPCVAGSAVFGELLAPGFLDEVAGKGEYMLARLTELKDDGLIAEVRGIGLMLAIELTEPRAADIVSRAFENKIIINNTSETAVRFLPPLVAEAGMIDTVVEFLQTALDE